jgi:hypothetical protein
VSSLFPVEPEDESARLQFLYDRLAARFGFAAAEVRLSDRKLTGGEIVYGRPHRHWQPVWFYSSSVRTSM